MNIRVERAEPKDAAGVIELVRDSILKLCIADHRGDQETISRWLANKTTEHFLTWISNVDNACVVAKAGFRVVGVGLVHRSGEIRLFYVAPGMQREGIGRLIHRQLEAAAIRWQLTALRLESTADARVFYEALGYQPHGEPESRFGVLQSFPYQKLLPKGEGRY